MKGGVSKRQLGGRASTNKRCDLPYTFQTPNNPKIKSAGDGKSSAIRPLYNRATSAAYSFGDARWHDRAIRACICNIKSFSSQAGGSAKAYAANSGPT
jgi:hypothetical protein